VLADWRVVAAQVKLHRFIASSLHRFIAVAALNSGLANTRDGLMVAAAAVSSAAGGVRLLAANADRHS
jgi:hypothetical protein